MAGQKQESLLGLSFVKQLIEARQAKHLTAEDVANELRLSVGIIKDIESGCYPPEKLTVFIKGYIRAYAKLVGVDIADVDHYFSTVGVLEKQPDTKPATFEYKEVSSKDKRMKLTTILIIVVLLILLVIWIEWQRSVDSVSTSMTSATVIPSQQTQNQSSSTTTEQ